MWRWSRSSTLCNGTASVSCCMMGCGCDCRTQHWAALCWFYSAVYSQLSIEDVAPWLLCSSRQCGLNEQSGQHTRPRTTPLAARLKSHIDQLIRRIPINHLITFSLTRPACVCVCGFVFFPPSVTSLLLLLVFFNPVCVVMLCSFSAQSVPRCHWMVVIHFPAAPFP